jgi:8-oxo-dGTP diphosphatase
MTEYQNPAPVVVGLIPVVNGSYIGLLLVRRAVEPGKGMLALPGGFLEMEPWREGLSREMREETGLETDTEEWRIIDAASSEPNPNRVLLFAEYEDWFDLENLPAFVPNDEVIEMGLVYRMDEFLQDQIVFPLHYDQIKYFLEGTSNELAGAPSGFQPLP